MRDPQTILRAFRAIRIKAFSQRVSMDSVLKGQFVTKPVGVESISENIFYCLAILFKPRLIKPNDYYSFMHFSGDSKQEFKDLEDLIEKSRRMNNNDFDVDIYYRLCGAEPEEEIYKRRKRNIINVSEILREQGISYELNNGSMSKVKVTKDCEIKTFGLREIYELLEKQESRSK